MNKLKEKLPVVYKHGIIPVFCPKNPDELNVFVNAFVKTPLRVIEITLRSEFAPEAIKTIKQSLPDFCVGAGTILNKEALNLAIHSGADFLGSPGYSNELIDEAKAAGIPFLPGCSTPSEIQNAMLAGFSTVKFFPAQASGGPDVLKLYSGAFEGVSFISTGGITTDNLAKYLSLENVLACGGSFMIPKNMLASGDSEGIYKVIMQCLSVRGDKNCK